MQSYVKIRDSD